MRKILNWIMSIGLGLLILLVILSLISKFTRKDNILGFVPMKVLSGSMEPRINVGDVVLVRKVDSSIIEKGDIITYKIGTKTYVTHRVIEVLNEGENILFRTKGDANNAEDDDLVLSDSLVGKLTFRIPKLGYVADFITRPIGFVLFFILPIIILLGKEIIYLKA